MRRLSILGRAGPPEHLKWIGQWGIFDALRAGGDVVRVAERPELGLRPRLAVGIHQQGFDARRAPGFAGTIWVQQGSRPMADDAEEVLRGAAVLAARIMSRLSAKPSTHAMRARQLLGLAERGPVDVDAITQELGIVADGSAALIGFHSPDHHDRLADVLALSANAFRFDAQVGSRGSRVYVLLPQTTKRSSLHSWIRGTISALHTELGLQLRAVVAAPLPGLAGLPAVRAEVDRVLDSAARHPDSFGKVTSLAEARTTVLLDEIVTMVGADRAAGGPAVTRPARPRPGAGGDAAGLSGQLRGRRGRGATAARPPQHRALPGPPDRDAAVDVAGRSRCATAVLAGIAGTGTNLARSAQPSVHGHIHANGGHGRDSVGTGSGAGPGLAEPENSSRRFAQWVMISFSWYRRVRLSTPRGQQAEFDSRNSYVQYERNFQSCSNFPSG